MLQILDQFFGWSDNTNPSALVFRVSEIVYASFVLSIQRSELHVAFPWRVSKNNVSLESRQISRRRLELEAQYQQSHESAQFKLRQFATYITKSSDSRLAQVNYHTVTRLTEASTRSSSKWQGGACARIENIIAILILLKPALRDELLDVLLVPNAVLVLRFFA